MRIRPRLLFLLSLLPLMAAGGSRTHNSLNWDALGRKGGVTLKSGYKEYVGHPDVEQKWDLQLSGAPPLTKVVVQVRGGDLLAPTTDVDGRLDLLITTSAPAVEASTGRPGRGDRLDAGDAVRVYDPQSGEFIEAYYRYIGTGD
ncbi:MAG: hypothetical protein DWQ01_22595 [Planctomycetota bacterium]|nr:MAG: hypothetical protein DWQ01_22595 [Planctomycetota bacterium]